MAYVAAAAAIAGAALSAYGSVQQGKAAQEAANFEAAINLQQADRERQLAEAAEADFRKDQSRLLAQRRAVLGASGVESTTGSPLLVSEDFVGEVELEALRIRNGGEVSATRLEQQAILTQSGGANAASAANLRAGASLLQGIGTAAVRAP